MPVDQTKLAMFWAALAAQCAGETHVTGNRLVASLLRTRAAGDFCARAGLDSARVLEAIDDPRALSFEECKRGVLRDLAEKGIVFASKQHQATVETRPLEPIVRPVMKAVFERFGHIGAPPLELLRDLIRADPALAERLAPHGLDAESLGDALDER